MKEIYPFFLLCFDHGWKKGCLVFPETTSASLSENRLLPTAESTTRKFVFLKKFQLPQNQSLSLIWLKQPPDGALYCQQCRDFRTSSQKQQVQVDPKIDFCPQQSQPPGSLVFWKNSNCHKISLLVSYGRNWPQMARFTAGTSERLEILGAVRQRLGRNSKWL